MAKEAFKSARCKTKTKSVAWGVGSAHHHVVAEVGALGAQVEQVVELHDVRGEAVPTSTQGQRARRAAPR